MQIKFYFILTLFLLPFVQYGQEVPTKIQPLPRQELSVHDSNEIIPTLGNIENIVSLNTLKEEYAPQVSSNGRYLVFQSDRPGSEDGFNLWISENKNYKRPREKGLWTKPIPLSFPLKGLTFLDGNSPKKNRSISDASASFSVNTDQFEGFPSLVYSASLARELYFSFAKTKGESKEQLHRGTLFIYHTRFEKEKNAWSEPSPIREITSDFDESMPTLSHKANYLVFTSNRPGGYGQDDLWISERNSKTGKWKQPINAGENINTNFKEIAPRLSPDGKVLFFSSNRPGGMGQHDLYMSVYKRNSWSRAKILPHPFNSPYDDGGFSMSHDGIWAYFSSDWDKHRNAVGFSDIYRALVPLYLFHPSQILFTGQVKDGAYQETVGVEATIKINFGKNTQIVRSWVFTEKSGSRTEINNFSAYLISGKIYRIQVSSPGFIPQEFVLNYQKNIPSGKKDRHVITLERIGSNRNFQERIPVQEEGKCKNEEAICLDKIRIYFRSNSSQVSLSKNQDLQKVIRILKKLPNLKVSIEGHTDTRFTENYNKKLSQKRARAVQTILVKAGINKKRIPIKGYGFLKLARKEKSEKDRAQNRRVEFIRLP